MLKSISDNHEAVRSCIAEIIALPLLIPGDLDYPEMIAKVARRRPEHRPAGVKGETPPAITLRPITDDDREFLFHLYASTRAEEKALVGWSDEEWNNFLRMQFNLQHTQYMRNYQNPSLDIIMLGRTPAGRLYVSRGEEEIRIVDICLMPEFRRRGIGVGLMKRILREGDDGGIPVTLHVERNNPALALYSRLGFHMENFTDVYCFMKRPPGQTGAHTGHLVNGNGERGT